MSLHKNNYFFQITNPFGTPVLNYENNDVEEFNEI